MRPPGSASDKSGFLSCKLERFPMSDFSLILDRRRDLFLCMKDPLTSINIEEFPCKQFVNNFKVMKVILFNEVVVVTTRSGIEPMTSWLRRGPVLNP